MIDWRAVDTVLLDMDGTLLDLHFDNYFWLTHLPSRYAEHHGICPDDATRKLHQLFNEKRGSLEWYCLDYWAQSLAMDIRLLKEEVQHLIAERPQAINFLQMLKASKKNRILITNAHRQSLDLKLSVTGIAAELDCIISSHDYGFPKEDPQFWGALESRIDFDPGRTLFIDDSLSVLRAAETYGIKYLIAIRQPDSKGQELDTGPYAAIHHFDEITPRSTTAVKTAWTKSE